MDKRLALNFTKLVYADKDGDIAGKNIDDAKNFYTSLINEDATNTDYRTLLSSRSLAHEVFKDENGQIKDKDRKTVVEFVQSLMKDKGFLQYTDKDPEGIAR